MSQKRPAPHPLPSPVRSSASVAHISPDIQRSSLRGGGDPSEDGSQESGSVRSYGEWSHSAQRSSGVHKMLNHPSSQSSAPVTATTASAYTASHGSPGLPLAPQPTLSTPTQRPLLFQGYAMSSQQHDTRHASAPGLPAAGPPSARGPPGPIQPLTTFGSSRQYLVPRSPRASSFSQGPLPQTTNAQQVQYPGQNAAEQRPSYSRDTTTPASPLNQPRPQLTQRLSGSGLREISTPGSMPSLNATPRSLSQPVINMLGAPAQRAQEVSDHPQRHPIFPPSSSYPTSLPPTSRGFTASSPTDARWSPLHGGPQGGRSAGMPEEQSTLVFATPGGEPVTFTIDKTNGSRQADEKRQRNAGASARFRMRKKEKDQQKEAVIDRLQAQNRELERQIQELKSENERYRVDRDRLRNVVHRIPSVSDLAFQGPPSPPPRSSAPFAAQSGYRGVSPHSVQPGLAYGEEDSATAERPSRRRRTDPQLDLEPPPFSITLPPPSYSAPMSQPGTPSAGGHLERLPPLRLDRAAPGAPPTAASAPGNISTHGFSPVKRESYEAGWATRPFS